MYTGSHSNPDMCSVVFMCVYVICDLKSCVNYVNCVFWKLVQPGHGYSQRGK